MLWQTKTLFRRRAAVSLAALVLLLLSALPLWAGQGALLSVQVFGHRGFTLHQPENSLGAIRAAIELGLHGCEVDLRTTSDGAVVLMHDATLERTTTGRGEVKTHTLAQLEKLHLKDRQGRVTAQRIPTLSQVLALVKRNPPFRLVLDLKQVDPAQVARMVREHGLSRQVVFFVSSPQKVDQVRAIQAVNPKIGISVNLLSWWKIEGLPSFAVKALGVSALFASEWFFPRCGFQEARQAGAEVMVYLWGTHDLPARMRRAVALGAQGVACDRPDLLLPLVRPRREVKP